MAWQMVNVDGTQRWHYRQEFAQECGPSSVAMISRIVTGKGTDISNSRRLVAGVDRRHKGFGNANWTIDWSFIESLTFALSELGVKNARTRRTLDAAAYKRMCWTDSTPSKPSILRVQWASLSAVAEAWNFDGGHFVVCLGRSAGGLLNILDPACDAGLVTVPDWGMFATYDAPYGGNGYLDRNYSVSTS